MCIYIYIYINIHSRFLLQSEQPATCGRPRPGRPAPSPPSDYECHGPPSSADASTCWSAPLSSFAAAGRRWAVVSAAAAIHLVRYLQGRPGEAAGAGPEPTTPGSAHECRRWSSGSSRSRTRSGGRRRPSPTSPRRNARRSCRWRSRTSTPSPPPAARRPRLPAAGCRRVASAHMHRE